MIDFQTSKLTFKLKPISVEEGTREVEKLLLPGETVQSAFVTVRDKLVFTDRRIISVDHLDGMRKKITFTSLPYSKILYYSVQTANNTEMIPDGEFYLVFADGLKIRFYFKEKVDILSLGQLVSRYVLAGGDQSYG